MTHYHYTRLSGNLRKSLVFPYNESSEVFSEELPTEPSEKPYEQLHNKLSVNSPKSTSEEYAKASFETSPKESFKEPSKEPSNNLPANFEKLLSRLLNSCFDIPLSAVTLDEAGKSQKGEVWSPKLLPYKDWSSSEEYGTTESDLFQGGFLNFLDEDARNTLLTKARQEGDAEALSAAVVKKRTSTVGQNDTLQGAIHLRHTEKGYVLSGFDLHRFADACESKRNLIVVLPASVDGIPLVRISPEAFTRRNVQGIQIKALVIPPTIEHIASGAFASLSVETIALGAGIKDIAEGAAFSCEMSGVTPALQQRNYVVSEDNASFSVCEGSLYSANGTTLYAMAAPFAKCLILPDKLEIIAAAAFLTGTATPRVVIADKTLSQVDSKVLDEVVWIVEDASLGTSFKQLRKQLIGRGVRVATSKVTYLNGCWYDYDEEGAYLVCGPLPPQSASAAFAAAAAKRAQMAREQGQEQPQEQYQARAQERAQEKNWEQAQKKMQGQEQAQIKTRAQIRVQAEAQAQANLQHQNQVQNQEQNRTQNQEQTQLLTQIQEGTQHTSSLFEANIHKINPQQPENPLLKNCPADIPEEHIIPDEELVLPAQINGYPLYRIAKRALMHSSKILILPSSIIKIQDENACLGLQSVVFPEHLRSIGAHSFRSRTMKDTVLIPQNVNSIGQGCFEYAICKFEHTGEIVHVPADQLLSCFIEHPKNALAPHASSSHTPAPLASTPQILNSQLPTPQNTPSSSQKYSLSPTKGNPPHTPSGDTPLLVTYNTPTPAFSPTPPFDFERYHKVLLSGKNIPERLTALVRRLAQASDLSEETKAQLIHAIREQGRKIEEVIAREGSLDTIAGLVKAGLITSSNYQSFEEVLQNCNKMDSVMYLMEHFRVTQESNPTSARKKYAL